MKNFQEWLENRVFRIDPEKNDFDDHSKLKQYFFTKNGSGQTDSPNTVPDWGKSMEGSFKTGLFAGKYHDITSYLIPRNLPWILVPTFPKKTIYIRKQDVSSIQRYSPWISSFKQSDFQVLDREGQGEYFAEKPTKAHQQKQIKNNWRVLQSKFNVMPVDDIMAKHQELKNKNIGFDAEGSMFVQPNT